MINSDPSQIKSIKPLKGFVGVYNPDYFSNKQQDLGEFFALYSIVVLCAEKIINFKHDAGLDSVYSGGVIHKLDSWSV